MLWGQRAVSCIKTFWFLAFYIMILHIVVCSGNRSSVRPQKFNLGISSWICWFIWCLMLKRRQETTERKKLLIKGFHQASFSHSFMLTKSKKCIFNKSFFSSLHSFEESIKHINFNQKSFSTYSYIRIVVVDTSPDLFFSSSHHRIIFSKAYN